MSAKPETGAGPGPEGRVQEERQVTPPSGV